MNSVNKVIIVGQLGRDPEIRSTSSGAHVASLSVATTTSYKKDGEWVKQTEWNKVSTFNDFLVEQAQKMKKGDTVYLEGTLKTRKWTGQDGRENYTTEVILEPFKGVLQLLNSGTMADQGYVARGSREQSRTPARDNRPLKQELDDEIPF